MTNGHKRRSREKIEGDVLEKQGGVEKEFGQGS